MTLRDRLLARIAAEGPISLADYMGDCLLHPEFGYYATRDPLGAAGDFTTAPEISQMFGELLGLCLAQVWMDQGAKANPVLLELGPGRGTLIQDILRATAAVPGFAPRVALLEASATLRARQRELLGDQVTWSDNLDALPGDGPVLCVANEFFDALPIRQFQRDGEGWRERRIGAADDALQFGLAQRQAQPALEHRLADTKDGDIVEHCPALPGFLDPLTQAIATRGGAALIVDYGDWGSQGDTFQALQTHEPTNPLANPGAADLTAHVDFESIARHAAPARHTRLTLQGVFLERLGITARAQALAAGMEGDALDNHIAAHRRLTHPSEMGTLFKVLGLYPDNAPPPPGLEP